MKKNIYSLIAICALSNIAYAGGDIAPIEPVVETPVIAPEKSTFYLGLGVGSGMLDDDTTKEEIKSTTLTIQAGYQYNEYLALEGRYLFGFNTDYDGGNTGNLTSDYDGDFSSWGIYVKPIYPVGDFSLYALLGYGGVMLDDLVNGDAYESGFQWGLGASYAATDTISVFVDYVSLYDDTGFDYRAKNNDIKSDAWTLGVSYNF